MQLLTELLSNMAAALVAAFLLAKAAGLGFGARVLFVALLGLFSNLDLRLSASYCNLYGFPSDYTLAVLAEAGPVGLAGPQGGHRRETGAFSRNDQEQT